MKKILTITFFAAALLFIFAVYIDNDIMRTITKPIPLIALLLLIKPNYTYSKLIFVGFIFSLFGDVFLMKTVDNFILGLASFLIAHVFYIIAFVKRYNYAKWTSAIPFYIAAAALSWFFYSDINSKEPDLLIPVLVYIFVIITMVWRSFLQRNSAKFAFLAFLGAILFAFSDSTIAYDRFHEDFEYSKIVIITAYWSAQYLIYLSTTQKN